MAPSDTRRDVAAEAEGQLGVMEALRASKRALVESEERLRFTLEAARVGCWDWNISTGEVKWSENLEAIHDRPPGTFGETLQAVLDEVYPVDRPHVEAAIQRALSGGEAFEIEYRILRRDGTLGWLHGQGRATFDEDGRPTRMAGICMDVTERRRADEITRLMADAGALLDGSLDVQTTLENVAALLVPALGDWCAIDLVRPDRGPERVAVVHADPQKTHLAYDLYRRFPPEAHAPRGMPNVIRTGRAELYAENSAEMLRASTRDDEYFRMARELGLRSAMIAPLTARGRTLGAITLASGESDHRYTLRELRVLEELASRCALAVDNSRLYHEAWRELVERRQTEDKLREAREAAEAANRAKSEFLANMSHEIRTPMTAILGYADVLSRHLRDPDNLQCVETIRRNGRFLLELLDDILDLSRIEAGKLEIERRRFRPDDLIVEICSLMDVRAREKQLSLKLHYQGDLPQTIENDPTRLRQILVNLLGNAIKFTERGEVKLVVRLLREEEKLHFDVIDTGVGMTEAQKGRLFQPFTQADSSVTRRFGGSGLGLAICRRLTEMLGGEISFQSQWRLGSTFAFSIDTGPLDSVPMIAPRTSLELTALDHAESVRLDCLALVVDDRRDIRYLSQHFLEQAGARVKTAQNGREAIAMILAAATKGEPFDVIVLDMQMPEMDGYEAAARLRAQGIQTPIIALTAAAMQGDRERCIQAGCDDYTAKPIHGPRLVEMVARCTPGASAEDRDFRREPLHASQELSWNETTRTPAPRRPRRVLLVDDNPDICTLMSILLQMNGHEVRTAHSGHAAITAAREFTPDVVLLDLGLPDMSGLEVAVQFRDMPQTQNSILIALSGRGEPEDRRRTREAGFHHHVLKPAAPEELERLIADGKDLD
jgi:PAS domain S-box-containing protein